jgi:hypothetical protein
MNFAFVKQAFEEYYGKGSVRDVDFVPKCDGNFYMLFVHLECVTDEALSMIAALNSGKTLLLKVGFWDGNDMKTVKWRYVKSRTKRPPSPSTKKLLDYALAREWSANLQQEQRSRRDEKNEHSIKEVVMLIPKSATLVTLKGLTREASEHATWYKNAVYNARQTLDTRRIEDEDQHGTGSEKLETLEARLFALEVLNTNLVNALSTAAEQIVLIKIQQDIIKGLVASKA